MIKGKIAFYCDVLDVTRQGFYWYLKHRDDPWKYENIAEKMQIADILIIGTTLRRNGSMAEPIDEAQARALLRAAGREV